MVNQRKITSAEWDGDDLVVSGSLGDGTPDEDGMVVDPEWLYDAAGCWLLTGGGIRIGKYGSVVGAGTGVSRHGGAVRIAARITNRQVADMIVTEAVTAFTIGIVRPVIVKDDTAPAGRITGGTLSSVGLRNPPRPAHPDLQERELPENS